MIIGVSGCGSKGLSDNKIKIKEAESKSIKYTDFDNGLIKMKVPEGYNKSEEAKAW